MTKASGNLYSPALQRSWNIFRSSCCTFMHFSLENFVIFGVFHCSEFQTCCCYTDWYTQVSLSEFIVLPAIKWKLDLMRKARKKQHGRSVDSLPNSMEMLRYRFPRMYHNKMLADMPWWLPSSSMWKSPTAVVRSSMRAWSWLSVQMRFTFSLIY